MEPLMTPPVTPPAVQTPVSAPASGSSSAGSMLIGLIVGLLLGGAGGWYIGYMMKFSPAIAQMMGLPTQQEAPAAENDQIQVQAAAVEEENPLESLDTNPYTDVKVNPFE